jgi:predicted site-specific integrase-resolvase
MLSLTKAAEEVGISRSALFKAIKNGRVSATKNGKGEFIIDPAELFRVYQPVNKVNVNLYQPSQQQDMAKETAETVEITMLKQLLKQVESERDDLRRRLDDEAQERRKLTMLLTHQPPIETAPAKKEDPEVALAEETNNVVIDEFADETLTQRLVRKLFW